MPSHSLPEQFGRYRILKKLGEGGMATVYLAEDTQLGRKVAIKTPHFSEVLRSFRIVAIASLAGPDDVFVELNAFGGNSSEDHRAEAAVSDRQRFDPLRRGSPIPERQRACGRAGVGAEGDGLRGGRRSRGGTGRRRPERRGRSDEQGQPSTDR